MFVDMYIAIKEGDLEKGLDLQRRVIPICNALRGFDAPSTKVALSALGLCDEPLSMPLQPMIEPYRQRLIDMVKSGEYY